MKWNWDSYRKRCARSDYVQGVELYEQGWVSELEIEIEDGVMEARCLVKDHQTYEVSLIQYDMAYQNHLECYCGCACFQNRDSCKHVTAALLACNDQQEKEQRYGGPEQEPAQTAAKDPAKAPTVVSDRLTQALLETYREQAGGRALERRARLLPRLRYQYRQGYPSLSLQVGFDRLYVVRDVMEFLRMVQRKQTHSYGKGLTLYHGLEQFDEPSQALIRLLMDQFEEFRSRLAGGWVYAGYYGSASAKNEIVLTGSGFDRFFEMMCGKGLQDAASGSRSVFLEYGDPPVSLTLQPQGSVAEMTIEVPEDLDFFGSMDALYARSTDRILKCSDRFREKVYPLASQAGREMRIALHDLPTFCSCVLPEIGDDVEIDDPGALLQEYGPDECTVCFYFDIEDDVLMLRLKFRYNGQEIDSGVPPSKTPQLRRSIRNEQEAENLARRKFLHRAGYFYLEGDDAVFDFLSEELPRWHELGEVYVTDRLRGKRIQPVGSSVGVSLSGGTLLLELDTGGFPLEELEALYQSLLSKRRYHRLTDGRYLALDGSPCEKLAELTHMLQLPVDELKKGQIAMPAFRGLYLDEVLKDENGVQVHRDRQFRAMVRNFKAVAESDYQAPETIERVLRPYQKVGFYWLKTLESCGFGGILADEMGLGKTIQVIAFLLTVRRETVGAPSLIVCPASLILNWGDELARFAPELRTLLLMGTAAERKRLLAENGGDADVWVTSYELLRQDIERYAEQPFYCCVLDEGQHVKNRSTLASKAVKRIDAKQRFVLTGTPIENRLSELWNLFDFLMPGYLFTHGQFVDKLEKPVVKSGDQAAAAQLRRLVQPFLLRRLKRDVLRELPPKIEHIRRIPLSEEERKVYFAAAAAARKSLEGGEQGKLAVLAALTRLRQICCAPELCFENYTGGSSKLEACLELCAGMVENGHQILLFSQFTAMLELLRARLDKMRIRSFTLQGSTPKQERARLVKAFNAGEAPVFLISLKAGGVGLNLTAADVVIHYDPWWNLAAQEQATDRAHRIGQQSHVQVYKLIAQDSIEERILDLQSKKAALMETISDDDGGASILEMSRDDLLALL